MPAKQRIASFSRDILWGVGLWVKPVGIMVDMVGPHGGIWISSSAGLNNKQPWRLGSNPLQVRFVKKLLMATRNPASLNQLDMVNISTLFAGCLRKIASIQNNAGPSCLATVTELAVNDRGISFGKKR